MAKYKKIYINEKWQSTKSDDKFIRIYHEMQTSDAYRKLSGNAVKTYQACLDEAHNRDSRRRLYELFEFENLPGAEIQKYMARHNYFCFPKSHFMKYFATESAKTRVYTYLAELEKAGFIENVTLPANMPPEEAEEEMKKRRRLHLENIYKFSDKWQKRV